MRDQAQEEQVRLTFGQRENYMKCMEALGLKNIPHSTPHAYFITMGLKHYDGAAELVSEFHPVVDDPRVRREVGSGPWLC